MCAVCSYTWISTETSESGKVILLLQLASMKLIGDICKLSVQLVLLVGLQGYLSI